MTHLIKLVAVALALSGMSSTLNAQQLSVPVMERAVDDLDSCGYGKIVGLKADGDGFLAVRSGPGSRYSKIDEVHNGDDVWLFEQKGNWIGIVYDVSSVSCSPIDADRPASHKGKKGWVHKNWVQLIAG